MLFLQILAVFTTKRKREDNEAVESPNPASSLIQPNEEKNCWLEVTVVENRTIFYEVFFEQLKEVVDADKNDVFTIYDEDDNIDFYIKHCCRWHSGTYCKVKLDDDIVMLRYNTTLTIADNTLISVDNNIGMTSPRCCFKSLSNTFDITGVDCAARPKSYRKNQPIVCFFTWVPHSSIFLTVENNKITSCNCSQAMDKVHVVGSMKRNNTSYITIYNALNHLEYFGKLLKESNDFVLCSDELLEDAIEHPSTVARSFECHLVEDSNRIKIQTPFVYFDTKTNEYYRVVSKETKVKLTQSEYENETKNEIEKMKKSRSRAESSFVQTVPDEEQPGPSGRLDDTLDD